MTVSKGVLRKDSSTLSGTLSDTECSQTSGGKLLDYEHKSRKVDRKPWTVMSPRPIRRSTAFELMSERDASGSGKNQVAWQPAVLSRCRQAYMKES